MHWCVSFLEAQDMGHSVSPAGPAPWSSPNCVAGVFTGMWNYWGRQQLDATWQLAGKKLSVLTLSLALRSASQAMRCSPQSYWPVLTATCKGVLSSWEVGGESSQWHGTGKDHFKNGCQKLSTWSKCQLFISNLKRYRVPETHTLSLAFLFIPLSSKNFRTSRFPPRHAQCRAVDSSCSRKNKWKLI